LEKQLLYRIHVSGLVQGVGFRWSTAREASRLGITGYVRNLSDGSVYIEAEGSPDKLEEFLSWCRKGPGAGFVDHVGVGEGPPVGHAAFRIEH